MKFAFVTLFVLSCTGLAAGKVTDNPVNQVAEGETQTPVQKVVTLLDKLKMSVAEEGVQEELIWNECKTWCIGITAKKSKAIEDNQIVQRTQSQTILSLKGKVATLKSELADIEDNLKSSQKTIADLTGIRQKENAEWQQSSSDNKESLRALEKAIKVIAKATGGGKEALIQSQAETSSAVKNVLQSLPSVNSLSVEKLSLLSSFTSSGAGYAPASVTIQGILTDMYRQFATEMMVATREEAIANRNYENLMNRENESIKNNEKAKIAKDLEKSKAEMMLADMSENFDNTRAVLQADIKFFDETSATCKSKHDQWSQRYEMRAEEMAGIDEGLKILNDLDDKQQADAGAASFLQVSQDSPAENAYEVLKEHASRTHSLRLAQVAAMVRMEGGHFSYVIEQIDNMMQVLKEEGEADIQKRDWCKSEYQKAFKLQQHLKHEMENEDAHISKLDGLIDLRRSQKGETVKEIADLDSDIRDLKNRRQEEETAYNTTRDNNQDYMDALNAARDAITKYYKNNGIDYGPLEGNKHVLLQADPEESPFKPSDTAVSTNFKRKDTDMPDTEFSDKGSKKSHAKAVISFLAHVIQLLEVEMKSNNDAEAESVADFQATLEDALESRGELVKKKVTLDGLIGKRQDEKAQEEASKANNADALKASEEYYNQISGGGLDDAHSREAGCDFMIGRFYSRKQKREDEMSGLVSAKEWLAKSNHDNSGVLDVAGTINGAVLAQKEDATAGFLAGANFMKISA